MRDKDRWPWVFLKPQFQRLILSGTREPTSPGLLSTSSNRVPTLKSISLAQHERLKPLDIKNPLYSRIDVHEHTRARVSDGDQCLIDIDSHFVPIVVFPIARHPNTAPSRLEQQPPTSTTACALLRIHVDHRNHRFKYCHFNSGSGSSVTPASSPVPLAQRHNLKHLRTDHRSQWSSTR